MNLRCFIWTRDGSLSSSVLLAILKHPFLQELEINGRQHESNLAILPQFTSLRRIKLIMPTSPVVEILPAWLKSLISPLQNLTIVCKVGTAPDAYPVRILSGRKQTSTAVTDALLELISEDLSGLDELHLAGCNKVTHRGLVNALRHNKNGIKSLSMDNIAPSLVRHYP